jgi:hypothetical protein
MELRDILNLMLRKDTNLRFDWIALNERLTREEFSREGGLSNSRLDQSMRVSYLKSSPVRHEPVNPQQVTVTEPIMRTSFIKTTYQAGPNYQLSYAPPIVRPPIRVALQPSPQIYQKLTVAPSVNPTILFKPKTNPSPVRVSFTNTNHTYTVTNNAELNGKPTPSPPVTASDLSQIRTYHPLDSLEQVNSL